MWIGEKYLLIRSIWVTEVCEPPLGGEACRLGVCLPGVRSVTLLKKNSSKHPIKVWKRRFAFSSDIEDGLYKGISFVKVEVEGEVDVVGVTQGWWSCLGTCICVDGDGRRFVCPPLPPFARWNVPCTFGTGASDSWVGWGWCWVVGVFGWRWVLWYVNSFSPTSRIPYVHTRSWISGSVSCLISPVIFHFVAQGPTGMLKAVTRRKRVFLQIKGG